MIAHGLPVYVALAPVDMRFGYERLGGLVREKMQAEPRSRALFVLVGKRGHTMKVLTWDGTGVIVVHKVIFRKSVSSNFFQADKRLQRGRASKILTGKQSAMGTPFENPHR